MEPLNFLLCTGNRLVQPSSTTAGLYRTYVRVLTQIGYIIIKASSRISQVCIALHCIGQQSLLVSDPKKKRVAFCLCVCVALTWAICNVQHATCNRQRASLMHLSSCDADCGGCCCLPATFAVLHFLLIVQPLQKDCHVMVAPPLLPLATAPCYPPPANTLHIAVTLPANTIFLLLLSSS